ncbi:peptidoglycan hydrolase, partial [Granulicatella balaenopterae]
YAGTTENLYKEKGYLFKEIDARDIRRGDVFISGNEGYSLGAGGHTGIAYNDNSILHCTYKLDGIYLTPIKGYTAEHKYPVRWFRIVNR